MERSRAAVELVGLTSKLSRWRTEHGGRGRPIPAELWVEAAELAQRAGVRETARALGLDRERLARRVEARTAPPVAEPRGALRAPAGFVELDARRVFGRGKAVIRLGSLAGEQLELEVEVEGGALEVAQVARALWGRCP